MTPYLKKFLSINWILLALMLALAIFGIVAVYSATVVRDDSLTFWRKQAEWIFFGALTFFVVSLIDYRWIRWGALPIYLVSILLLILTKLKGKTVNGARSWLDLGPLHFQPAQVAVIAGILVLALFLSQFRNLHPMIKLLFCGAIVGAPCLLILLQPDLGEVIIWVPTVLALLFIAGIPLRYMIVIVLFALLALPVAYFFVLKPYQQQRITGFLNLSSDPRGANWDITQSLNAMGSGGWSGKGFMSHDTLLSMGVFKTAGHTDYIFTAIGEQWGFLGGVALLSAFTLLIFTGLFIAFRSSDDLGLLIAVGIVALIFTHIFQNVGMTIAMLPITGVPLPLVSYGGSFALVIMFGLGIINSVWVHRKVLP
ncbi:MAG TPA: FtsW/RodA/SpoVE family cell cycle protein [Chthoniobacteraceae bacterium]|nr:FtsW/RodA/SpoVE family cell cycle protein [Chthoniobacteraceae bacterium]